MKYICNVPKTDQAALKSQRANQRAELSRARIENQSNVSARQLHLRITTYNKSIIVREAPNNPNNNQERSKKINNRRIKPWLGMPRYEYLDIPTRAHPKWPSHAAAEKRRKFAIIIASPH